MKLLSQRRIYVHACVYSRLRCAIDFVKGVTVKKVCQEYYSAIKKKEGNPAIFDNIDGSRGHYAT